VRSRAAQRFAADEGFEILAEFVEVELAKEAMPPIVARNWQRRQQRRLHFDRIA
jgi:hypothetical protein